jgi:hypothetical protein
MARTSHSVTVQAIAATTAGALSGHSIACTCGTVLNTSLSSAQAERDGEAHVRWHARSGR